jgi:hypothetical protein
MATYTNPTRSLALLTGLTAGVLAALVLLVVLNERGVQIVEFWREHTETSRRLQASMAWWAVALIAFVAGGVAARPISRFPPPWRAFRTVRWVLGAAAVFALAYVAHGVAPAEGVSPAVQLLASLIALCLAAPMALFGAFFAARR